MSHAQKRLRGGLLAVLFVSGSVQVAFAECQHNETNNTYTWNDPGGWSSTVDADDATYTVNDPNWGYYDETYEGGQWTHVFLCAGQCDDSHGPGGTDPDHQISAMGYINEGNYANNCP